MVRSVKGLLETWAAYKIAAMILMYMLHISGVHPSRSFSFYLYLGSAPFNCRCLILRFTCHLRGIANIIINYSTAPDSHNHLSGSVANGWPCYLLRGASKLEIERDVLGSSCGSNTISDNVATVAISVPDPDDLPWFLGRSSSVDFYQRGNPCENHPARY